MQPNPHQAVHDLAAEEHEDHPTVLDDTSGQPLEEQIVQLDERLTKRINDLRKDSDTNRKAVSASVAAFQTDVADLKTAAENNAASVESLKGALNLASREAKAAKASSDEVAAQFALMREQLDQVQKLVSALRSEYDAHTHDLNITISGGTQPPKHQDHA